MSLGPTVIFASIALILVLALARVAALPDPKPAADARENLVLRCELMSSNHWDQEKCFQTLGVSRPQGEDKTP